MAAPQPQLGPLHQAAKQGDLQLLQQLLGAGHDVNERDVYGTTPLCDAAYGGHTACVQALLEAGADVDACDDLYHSPLLMAAWKGLEDCVRILLSHRAQVDLEDDYGRTPLQLAAWCGHEDCVRLLLQAGANLHYNHDDWEMTPLHFAATCWQKSPAATIRMLVAAGADLASRDGEGLSPLELALKQGERCKEAAELLQQLAMGGADAHPSA